MSTKCYVNWLILGLLTVVVIGLSVLVLPAQAAIAHSQAKEAAVEPSCNRCHDNLYFNYDLGKSYCVNEARTRCVDCHGGDPLAFDKAIAHTNMEAHPLKNEDVSLCQSCHPQDCAAHVDRFATIAGIRPINYVFQSAYRFTPSPLSTSFPMLAASEDISWQAKLLFILAAILLFAGWLVSSKFFSH